MPQSTRKDSTLLWLLSAIAVVIILGLAALFQSLNQMPVVKIPNPKMPSPNAYDYYTPAANAMSDVNAIGDALSPSSSSSTHVYTLTEKDALVAKNAKALSTLRQGFAYEYYNPPARSFAALFPYFVKYRNMARLLALEADTKAAHGDHAGAINCQIDALHFGEDMPRGGTLISMLVGVACQSIARRDVWGEIDHLSAQQAKSAAIRLESITSRHFPFWRTLQEEKWAGQASLMEIFRQKGWRKQLASITNTGTSGSGASVSNFMSAMFINKRRIMCDYTNYMDQYIANSKHPYNSKLSAPPPVPNDPFCSVWLPVFTKSRFAEARCHTQNLLLLTSLALRAYKVEHGAYPRFLQELAPGYLKSIPADPLALKGSFKYKLKGSGYVLYSVGPDGKDDGGRAIICTSRSGSPTPSDRHYVEQTSRGDIVAGVNVP